MGEHTQSTTKKKSIVVDEEMDPIVEVVKVVVGQCSMWEKK